MAYRDPGAGPRFGQIGAFRSTIAELIRAAGIDVVPTRSLRHAGERRRRLLRGLRVDLVIDVGANAGQFGADLRSHGYAGKILSLEPLREPFEVLRARAARDGNWDVMNFAIGPGSGTGVMNVAGNGGASSSFFPMLPIVTENAPDARYVGHEEVAIRRLDEVARAAMNNSAACFLKVDVQGAELQVLEASTAIVSELAGIQLEMSLAPQYGGAPPFRAVLDHVFQLGFELWGLDPGFAARNGRLLQCDGLFVRTKRS